MSAVLHHPIVARKVRFDFQQTPLHWVPQDPFTTHAINPLHLLLPAGELWFCRVYNRALPLISDAQLLADVKGFIGQEAIHSRAHSQVLHYYQQHGLDTAGYTRMVEMLFNQLLGQQPLQQAWLGQLLGERWLVFQVGVIAAIEHFTCVLGKWVLSEQSLDHLDATMLDLIRWHGAEEIEHRSVAYDLFAHLCQTRLGFYVSRQALMALVTPIFLGIWFKGVQFMIQQDAQAPAHLPTSVWGIVRRFEQVAATQHTLPSLRLLFGSLVRWAKPSYHPVQEADTQQALDYLARSPAALAATLRPC
ncbi:MAG: hypothetical protein RL180_438 [Pseudomonadota bacterium]|jgi:predicted metal-dependent hydrolase